MKKVVVILVTLFLLTLCGCKGSAKIDSERIQEESMFVIIDDTNIFYVVYHRDTKVMYAISHGGYNSGNFCLLVNPDGTPMLWKGEQNES